MPLFFKHNYICRNSVHQVALLEASVYTWHGPNSYTCVRKRCLSLHHSDRDAFSGAVIFLPRFVTKPYSLTLKITASYHTDFGNASEN